MIYQQSGKVPRRLIAVFMLVICNVSIAADDQICTDSAQQYWAKFRNAVLQSDVDGVANLSQFPFIVSSGLQDSDRKNKPTSRADFISIYPLLLIKDPGLSLKPSTMWDLISNSKKLTPDFCTSGGGQIRVGDWVFQLKDGKWRFVQVYIDNELN